MLKIYTLFGKIQGERLKSCERLISSEKVKFLAKMQPFPEIWLFFAEFGYFWSEFGYILFFLSANYASRLKVNVTHDISSTISSRNEFTASHQYYV